MYATEYLNDRGGWVTDGVSKDLNYELDRRRTFLINGVAAKVVGSNGKQYTEEDVIGGTHGRFRASQLQLFKNRSNKKKRA